MITNATMVSTNALADGLIEIKGPLVIPTGWEWLWWVLGALAVAAVLIGLLIFLLTRRKHVVAPPLVPPHSRALQQLEAALALLAEPKPFVIAVSDTLRGYLEERFSFRAPERTTEEFLHELQRTQLLLPDQKESLGEFLQSCDLVKFAKYEPAETELRQLHGAAVRLVVETEPQPERDPATGPAEFESGNPQQQ
jgi:hypothetical protein